MAEDLIRYDVLVQDALRGVVRKVLTEVVQAGLPGEHHFFIAFDTSAPGVRISSRIKQKYPEEMTIVLQHQFWGLTVTEHAFEVGLSFGGVPEKLYVPFRAIKGFFDPSVQFGLQFDPHRDEETETAGEDEAGEAAAGEPRIAGLTAREEAAPAAAAVPAAEAGAPEPAKSEGGAAVVSLDAFRRKT
ncbi:SspB family protein [Pseudoxanthobacter sp.]|uniref:SspB family protein n=1 Tax=Pseudoxanthobacter sp. TaxID=1925742 RepID=UPI002FDFAE23